MTSVEEAEQPTVGSMASSWWESLLPARQYGMRQAADPGALARLRRADLVGAAMEEVTIDLFRKLTRASTLPRNTLFERTALVAGVLAHVRETESRTVATAAGEKISDDQRRMHPLRLQRLFAVRSEADCLTAFRRLVTLLGGKANVFDLGQSLVDWPDDVRGRDRRRRWAFDYYGASLAAPKEQKHNVLEDSPLETKEKQS